MTSSTSRAPMLAASSDLFSHAARPIRTARRGRASRTSTDIQLQS
jgi:hypothetical protein